MMTAALVLCVVGALSAKPAWRALRAQKARRFITQAVAARAEKDHVSFLGNLRAANELDPHNPEVLRLNAQHYSRFGSPEGLMYWHLLEQAGQSSREDRLSYARLALACDLTDLARTILQPLHYGDPNDAEVLVVLSELFEREGDLPLATSAALDAITRDPKDVEAELRLAKLELASSDAPTRNAARARLYGLLSSTNSIRSDAAMVLLLADDQPPADLNLIARLLDRQPAQSFRDRLARVLVELRRNPDRREPLLARLAAPGERDLSPQERGLAAEKLGAAREFKAVLAIIPESVAITNRHFAVFRLSALASIRDLAGMERFLKHPDQPLPPSFAATFRATLASLANRTNEAPLLWKAALAESVRNPTALRALALQAERAEAYDVAIRCWENLMENTVVAPFAAKQVLRLAKLVNDPRAAYVALRRMVALKPGNAELKLPLAYYQALLELEPAETERILAMAAGAPVDRELFTLVSALFALRNKQPDRATELLEGGAISWTNVPTSWLAVRIAAMGGSGNHSQAREFASNLVRERLSAQELALVQSWLPNKPNSAAE